MATTITNLTNHLEIAFSSAHLVTVPKAGLRVATKNDYVYLIPKGLEKENWGHANVIRILYTDAVPLLGTAELLMDTIIGYLDEYYASSGGGGSSSGAGGGSVMIGSDLGAYTFDASAKTVTLTGIHALAIEEILQIINITDQEVIYSPSNSGKGGTISGNIITLEFDTTSMSDADDLQIYVQYNNSEDYDLKGIKAYIQNAIPPNYEGPSGDLLAGTPFEFTASFVDICSEIPMNGSTRLRVWFTIDIGTSVNPQIRALFKHESAGAEEYREIYLSDPSANLSTINLHDYEIDLDGDHLFSFVIETDGTVPFIQLQSKDDANGDGQIDALYVTKAWV